jgi:hypothetical protein
MADRMGLSVIGMLLCAATLFVIAVGGYVVRGTLTSGTDIGGNVYGLQSMRLSDTPRLHVVADDRS